MSLTTIGLVTWTLTQANQHSQAGAQPFFGSWDNRLAVGVGISGKIEGMFDPALGRMTFRFEWNPKA